MEKTEKGGEGKIGEDGQMKSECNESSMGVCCM